MKEKTKLRPPDFWLIVSVVALVVIGLVMVLDASFAKAADSASMNHDPFFLLKKQARSVGLGLVLLLVAMKIPFPWLRILAWPGIAVSAFLLVVVLFCGHTAYGATSWLRFMGVVFQPSELAKVALVLFLAAQLSPARTFARRAPRRWILAVGVCSLLTLLVVLERDLGTAALLVGISLAMFFAAGAKKRYIAFTVAGMFAAGMLAMTHIPHCRERLNAYMDPWKYRFEEGYQTVHSLAGIGTGGLLGVGFCEGRVKFYMPAASTDYIFSTVVEETGLVGAAVVMFVFGVFAYRGLHIACCARSTFASLLAAGVVAMVSVQAVINIAVVTKAIPATGLSLPFISYGGSGVATMLACIGILISVSRNVDYTGEHTGSDESSSGRRRNRRSHIPRDKRGTGSSAGGSRGRVAVRG